MKPARYGAGRLTAAVLGAPLAALLVAVAAPAVVPARQDLRYLVSCVLIVPLMAAAPFPALMARSGKRAWAVIGVVCGLAAAVLWSAYP